jgi:histidine triad (HIT) family protein
MTNSSCIFCGIVAGEIPATIVAESDYGIAFRDLSPRAPIHVLVIPRRHVDSLAEASLPGADGAELGDLLRLAGEVARVSGVADTGYRVVANTGREGGQTVGHLHFHVLGGRQMAWPPG